MKHRIVCWVLTLSFVNITVLVVAHEKTGWIAPEEARKVNNPVKATNASIEKGKTIYEKKCVTCHGIKGDGKGPVATGLNPKPTDFTEFHGKKMTDGEHFWKVATGKGGMPSFGKDLTDEERWHVINYMNTFSKHK